MTITSILCPVDFSPHAERALRHAVALADLTRAHLTVLTVTDPLLDAAARASGDDDTLASQTQDEITRLLARHWPVPDDRQPPAIAVEVGTPDSAIIKQAAASEADLIVMGTQGLGGARKLLFGSTAERVLRQATVPVLAVPAGPDRIVAEPEGPRLRVARVLVPVDITQAVTHLGVAGEWARLLGATARLLYVSPNLEAPFFWQADVGKAHAGVRAEAAARLEALTPELGPDLHVETAVRGGKPAAEIAQAAGTDGCGLIILGLGGERSRPGTIAYRVVALADAPVLVVPPPA